MDYKELCIERVQNGFVIEAEPVEKKKKRGIGAEMYSEPKKAQFIAANEKEAMKIIKDMIGSLASGMDDE